MEWCRVEAHTSMSARGFACLQVGAAVSQALGGPGEWALPSTAPLSHLDLLNVDVLAGDAVVGVVEEHAGLRFLVLQVMQDRCCRSCPPLTIRPSLNSGIKFRPKVVTDLTDGFHGSILGPIRTSDKNHSFMNPTQYENVVKLGTACILVTDCMHTRH